MQYIVKTGASIFFSRHTHTNHSLSSLKIVEKCNSPDTPQTNNQPLDFIDVTNSPNNRNSFVINLVIGDHPLIMNGLRLLKKIQKI